MSTAKSFYEVFPTLKLSGETGQLFQYVGVKKIRTTTSRDVFHVYIESPNLISKDQVHRAERELAKQLFPRARVSFRLHESFLLSDQYTPESLMDAYKESVSMELREEEPILNQMYRHANISYGQNGLVTLTIPDNLISHQEGERLADYLAHVMNVRCGLHADIRISYKAEEKPEGTREAEIRVQQQIAEITRRALEAAGQKAEKQEEKKDEKAEKAADQKTAPEKKSGSTSSGSGGNFGGKRNGRFSRGGGFQKRSNNPDVIRGADFDDEPIPIKEIVGEIGEVVIKGQLIFYEEHEIRNERTIVSIDITDYTDSITMKLFLKNEEIPEFREAVGAGGLEKGKPGQFVKVHGFAQMDNFDHDVVIGSIRGIKKIGSFIRPRMDTAPEKRVELHCHTKYSEMDGVSDVSDILKRADKWGWNACAITDHGNVQVFPVANHVKADLSNPDFKVIYGCEGYLVDDMREAFFKIGKDDGKTAHTLKDTYVVFDIETTGFSPNKDKIIEIGAVRVENGVIVDHYDEFINPEIPIPFRIQELTSINDNMVSDAGNVEAVLPGFLEFSKDAIMVAHNAKFDTSFISKNAERLNLPFNKAVVDTVEMARFLLPDLKNYKLDTVADELKVSLENHHRAVDDAECTAEIFLRLCQKMTEEKNIGTMEELQENMIVTPEGIRKLPTFHIILLAKNEIGRVNLYRLVSMAHINYWKRRPRIPKSKLQEYREGIIVGSACEAGEVFRALEREIPEENLARVVDFYDYLEIQPIGNNQFLLEKEDSGFDTVEDLQDINRRIVKLGEEFKKPVVATCDVHFLDPQDEIYRRIIQFGKGFDDADNQAPLYLRTTDEMLQEFMYLGEDKAREVVLTNTNMIADMIDYISPVRPDKAPPVIENSDQMLRDICYNKARELYGDDLPHQVSDRLEVELKSIIGNGYAVMYVIAQKLVWKSVEDGYLVGSRGSVGSSFVANMAGITEVNSLAAHYLCPECHYYDFESEVVKDFQMRGMSGCDMPDAVCPKCGAKLMKMGFDIPFETFLGFSGDKEPDIDLNFSGDYQSKAHKYTEVIFGAGQTFRAGTIGTLAEKTAYGYVLKYYEDERHNEHKRRAEIERIAHGCEGVLRTTGQHPGGIVVMPRGEQIYSFTPIQKPANDMSTNIITTHFEYHSIDHNLLKLDILGHDDPTMIRFLQDATGVDPLEIPLDDKKVMSLFSNTEALGIQPEDIGGVKTGTLGVPEYGTDFAIQMLLDTKPVSFSDLIRISGLSHGTDVYAGNAELLIKEKGLKLAECICCRDDIMIYLIAKGMDPALSFKTMESVRKGKGLKPEMKEAMVEHDVPDWYIESCLKIKYMFPKAHAAAYVMMAWRVAWFKVYRPLAYYSAFFSIRAVKGGGGLNYETMCRGRGRLEEELKKLTDKQKEVGKNKMTATELDTIRNMNLVLEMYARGFDFAPIDLNTVDAKYFRQVDDKRIMPALNTVPGMGGKDADDLVNAITNAADKGEFLSVDDFCIRTGCSRNKADKLKELGLLGNIPDSNQLSLFDLIG